MKLSLLVLAVFAFSLQFLDISATVVKDKIADQKFLERQNKVLQLVIGLTNDDKDFEKYAEFDITDKQAYFTVPEVLTDFLSYYQNGRFEVVYSTEPFEVLRLSQKLFNLFYSAKDFEKFYEIASWTRYKMNAELFFYPFSAAVAHRADCVGLVLPPIYEIFPNYFVPTNVVYKMYQARMQGKLSFTTKVNTSGWESYASYMQYDNLIVSPVDSPFEMNEDILTYFTEDVGLSEFVSQFFIYYMPFYELTNFEDVKYFHRGEILLSFLQKIYARYTLERVSNKLRPIEILDWAKPIKVGYNPRLATPSGYGFISRPDGIVPETANPAGVSEIRRLERRIVDLLDSRSSFNGSAYFDGKHDLNMLGSLIFGTDESPSFNFYNSYFFKGLSVLNNLATPSMSRIAPGSVFYKLYLAQRDPAFYSFVQRILYYLQKYQKSLPAYTGNDLFFPGVKVESLDVDNLVTYTDFDYELEVNNMFPSHVPGHKYFDYKYSISPYRLNYKPFHYKLTVDSENSGDAMVRVFIGPKELTENQEYTLNQARQAFVEFDRFPAKLTRGKTVIKRSSEDSSVYENDHEGLRTLFNRVNTTLNNKQEQFSYTESFRCGFPSRLLLPRGTKSGKTFVFYAIVTPYEKKPAKKTERTFENFAICGGYENYDRRSFGFPFDRYIESEDQFHVANSYFKDVTIYYEQESDLNRIKS